MYNILSFVLAYILVVLPVEAQQSDFVFHHISEEDGLTKAERYFLSKDREGFVWIGTEEGLLRFDGKEIVKFINDRYGNEILNDNEITSQCFEDEKGDLWFSTSSSITRYNRVLGIFETFEMSEEYQNYQMFFKDNTDVIWLAVDKSESAAIYSFNVKLKKFQYLFEMPQGRFYPIADEGKNLSHVIGTSLLSQAGVVVMDIDSKELTEVDFSFNSRGSRRFFLSPGHGMYFSGDSTVWVGVYNGLGHFKLGQTEGVVEIDRDRSVSSDFNWIWSIVEYNSSQFLVATDKGLMIFDRISKKFTKQFKPNSSKPYEIKLKQPNNLMIDEDNVLWIAGQQNEISFSQLDKSKFPSIESTIGRNVISINQDLNGDIWCSTLESGTYVFDIKHNLLAHHTELRNNSEKGSRYPLPVLEHYFDDKNYDMWGVHGNNFIRWNKEDSIFEIDRRYFLGTENSEVGELNLVCKFSDELILAALGHDIYYLNTSKESVELTLLKNIEEYQLTGLTDVYKDKSNNILVGDNEGNVVLFENEQFLSGKLLDSTMMGTIYSFYDDGKGSVLITSSNGIWQLNKNKMVTTNLPFINGIPKETFYDIKKDKTGYLWITGNNGLIRYNPSNEESHRFGTSDGLLSNVINRGAFLYVEKTNEIWVGGKNGLNIFNPDNIEVLSIKPSVQLTNLLVNDEIFDFERAFDELQELKFTYRNNTLSFNFTILDYSAPGTNQYYYQMEGVDQERVSNGNTGFARGSMQDFVFDEKVEIL